MSVPLISPHEAARLVATSGALLVDIREPDEYRAQRIESAVLRSEERTEESRQGSANLDSGVPETNFRGDGFGGTQSASQSSRESRKSNFEINKEV